MHDAGEAEKGVIKPEINRLIMIDFKGPKIISDASVLMLREISERDQCLCFFPLVIAEKTLMTYLAGEMTLDQVCQTADAAYNCLKGRLAA